MGVKDREGKIKGKNYFKVVNFKLGICDRSYKNVKSVIKL